MDKIQQFHEIISQAQNILVTSHIRPDPDAIGVALGMYAYLNKKYPQKNVAIYMTSEATDNWDFLKYADKLNWVDNIKPVLENFDTLIFLDGNSVGRFVEREPESVDLSKFKTICIDHHPNQPDPFTLDLSDITAASATELIYKLFFRSEPELLDSDIAKILMVGIMGDTGTFRYIKPANAETLVYAKELIDIGQFEIQDIDLHLSQFSEKEFELLQILIQNTKNVELPGIPPFTYSYLPMNILDKYSINAVKSASMVYKFNILRQIKGHNWGFIVTPDAADQIGISFRSTPGYPNAKVLANKFDGGGHIMAAGGKYMLKPGEKYDSVDLCEKIIETIKAGPLEMTSKS